MLVFYLLLLLIIGSFGDMFVLFFIEIDVDGVEEFEDLDSNIGFNGVIVLFLIIGIVSVILLEVRYLFLVYIRIFVSVDGEGGGILDGLIEVSVN